MKKKSCFRIACALAALAVLGVVSCKSDDDDRPTPTPVVSGQAIIKITFGTMPSDPVTVTGDATVAKGTALTVIVDNAADYTPFAWWLDGVKQTTTDSTYNTRTTLTEGLYRLTVVAYKDSVPFSKELVFTITIN